MKKLLSLLCIVMVLTGCMSSNVLAESNVSAEEEPTKIYWYNVAVTSNMTQDGLDEVVAECNRYMQEDLGINAELVMKLYDWSEYESKMNMVISSGEYYDLMFTASWLNSYSSNVAKNAFMKLDDLLPEYAPDIWNDIPDYGWDCLRRNNGIYAMFGRQTWGINCGWFIRKDVADAIGFEGNSYANGDKVSLDELEEIFAKMKEMYPDCYPCYIDNQSPWVRGGWCYGIYPLNDDWYQPAAIRFNEDDGDVFNMFESDEFMDMCKRVYRWRELGYIPEDASTYATQSDQILVDLKNGTTLTWKKGYDSAHTAAMAMAEAGWTEMPVAMIASDKIGQVAMTLNAVSANSEHPELAMQVYNAFYSDPYLYNTLLYGIEGEHYTKVSDNEIELIAGSNYNKPCEDFAIGNQFNGYCQYGVYPADVWEIDSKFGDDAIMNPLVNFAFDYENVKTEYSNCAAIVQEYWYPLQYGAVDPEEYIPEMNARLKTAGVDKIIAEAQAQIDAFLGK